MNFKYELVGFFHSTFNYGWTYRGRSKGSLVSSYVLKQTTYFTLRVGGKQTSQNDGGA